MNRNENVADFRIDSEDDDEIREEKLDEEEAREDVEKGIKGEEERMKSCKYLFVYLFIV